MLAINVSVASVRHNMQFEPLTIFYTSVKLRIGLII